MNYKILVNSKFDSKEVYFDGMPEEATRNNLKRLKFRWNPKKSCWYGFADMDEVKAACEGGKIEEKTPKKKAEKKNKYGVKVGDIFSASWGYDQTNNDFFQVIELVGETMARVREIYPEITEREATCPMAEDRVYKLDTNKIYAPASNSVFIKDQEKGDLKKIQKSEYGGGIYFKLSSFANAHLETSETVKKYESWYA